LPFDLAGLPAYVQDEFRRLSLLHQPSVLTVEVGGDIQVAIDTAADAGGGEVVLGVGTFEISETLIMASNVTLTGSGYGTVIKLADGANVKVISNTNAAPYVDNVTVRRLAIDGNRTNQTAAQECTAIKFYSAQDALIDDVLIYEVMGHGIHFNNLGEEVDGQRLSRVTIRGVGDDVDGTFGSCFAMTDTKDVIFDSCYAYDCYKAGFRLSGRDFVLNGCIAKTCGNGGIVPVSGDCEGVTVNGGFFCDNSPSTPWPCDGIRLVGAKRVVLNGVTCTGNADCGVAILQGGEEIEINGGIFRNNGQSADAVGATQRRSGIAVFSTSGLNARIQINAPTCIDDQATPTQDYGIEIDNTPSDTSVWNPVYSGNELGTLALLNGSTVNGAHSALAAETVTGYITFNDASGTPRKLAVVS